MAANFGSGEEEDFNTDGHGFPQMATDEEGRNSTRMKKE
jgi:hypothetical protein